MAKRSREGALCGEGDEETIVNKKERRRIFYKPLRTMEK